MMSKFIVVEGPDRVGKATQVKLLKDFFFTKNKTVATVEVPLRSNFMYHVIYWMLANGLAKRFPKLFQWFQYFNRQIFQWMILSKLEEYCDYIIMDRWSLSTVVYGAATGVSKEFTEKLTNRLKKPDFTIVLLGPSHKHEAEDVYESDAELQKRVRDLYRDWSTSNSQTSSIFDCSMPREIIHSEILKKLEDVGVIS